MSDTVEPEVSETEPVEEVVESEAPEEAPEEVPEEEAPVEAPEEEAPVEEAVPVEQVASDIREILTTTSESSTDPSTDSATESLDIHSKEYRKIWLAAGKRRRPDGTWRKLGEMV